MTDGYYAGSGGYYSLWENDPVLQSIPKKQDTIGLADAITKSILSAIGTRYMFLLILCALDLLLP